MTQVLLITVRFHEGRYHGVGDEPPSPARLFQALVAGIGQSGPLGSVESEPLEWLERLQAPVIASPAMTDGQAVKNFVPNNDFDAVGGDARRIGSIRTPKISKPKLFNQEIPILYAWSLDDNVEANRFAGLICEYADKLYQLGRGVDQAWACGEVIEPEQLDARLIDYRGIVFRPTNGGNGRILACPQQGSLDSLKTRFNAMSQRFSTEGPLNSAKQRFSQAPKPRFKQIAYESPALTRVYELRARSNETEFVVWPMTQISKLVVMLRDGAVTRLKAALPESEDSIEKSLVGRKANGDHDAPKSARVRILPLPSIGHFHVDHAIRRVLVEIPTGCLIRADDVHWAFSGLELSDPVTNETLDILVTPTSDEAMLRHYGVGIDNSIKWRSVTPVALPELASRRRIEPLRLASEFKGGAERTAEQTRAAASVVQALRHAEVRAQVATIRLQREPFEAKGERVETFAPGTRFAKERLWHVEILFAEPISGPLVIGDGRYFGLGLMAPVQEL